MEDERRLIDATLADTCLTSPEFAGNNNAAHAPRGRTTTCCSAAVSGPMGPVVMNQVA